MNIILLNWFWVLIVIIAAIFLRKAIQPNILLFFISNQESARHVSSFKIALRSPDAMVFSSFNNGAVFVFMLSASFSAFFRSQHNLLYIGSFLPRKTCYCFWRLCCAQILHSSFLNVFNVKYLFMACHIKRPFPYALSFS